MIPLRSSEPHYTRATVTLSIIAVNVAVFLYQLSLGLNSYAGSRFIMHFGLVPDRFTYSSVITSMFIHGGFLHIAGNMWFLWIYGRGIEDTLGHAKFVFFYLVCGVVAALAQIIVDPSSTLPTVGASGAIAGVMGAYLIKFPRARIHSLIIIVVFPVMFDIPAALMLVYWFIIQLFSEYGSIARTQVGNGGVAYAAHIGGFV